MSKRKCDPIWTVTISPALIDPGPSATHGQWELSYRRIVPAIGCCVCGHRLLDAEDGFVPATWLCEGCGRLWQVGARRDDAENVLTLTFSPSTGENGHVWDFDDDLDDTEEAFEMYSRMVLDYGGKPLGIEHWRRYRSLHRPK